MSSIRHDQAHRTATEGSTPSQGHSWDRAGRGTLSIVIPAKNEAANLPQLVNEVVLSFRPLVGRSGTRHRLDAFEVVIVDDGSTDATALVLRDLGRVVPELRPVTLAKNVGQSAATIAGFRASRGEWVGMLDADLQNPPAGLALMWDLLPGYDAALGWREKREDTWTKRHTSRLANRVRNAVLGQAIKDTGCSVRIMRRELAVRLPTFRGYHRFLGPLLIREGCRIVQMPVAHRPRGHGKSHYHFGNRSLQVVVDLLGVAWLLLRPVRYEVVSVMSSPAIWSEATSDRVAQEARS